MIIHNPSLHHLCFIPSFLQSLRNKIHDLSLVGHLRRMALPHIPAGDGIHQGTTGYGSGSHHPSGGVELQFLFTQNGAMQFQTSVFLEGKIYIYIYIGT